MRRRPPLVRANALAAVLPAALLAGALGSQYLGGLHPCEMCLWQRWPHYAALAAALVAWTLPLPPRRALVVFAGLAIALSGAIGAFHAGVEYGLWEGVTACTTTVTADGGDMLAQIMAAPLVRCDVAPWTLANVSLAGWNAVISIAGAFTILYLGAKR